MFIFADNAPPLGSLLRVNLFFPPVKALLALQLTSKCQVVRVDASEAYPGFAVLSKTFVLRNRQTNPREVTVETEKPN